METVEMRYCFKDEDAACKEVNLISKRPEGLTCQELCEMFEEFMGSAGFNLDTVVQYFRE